MMPDTPEHPYVQVLRRMKNMIDTDQYLESEGEGMRKRHTALLDSVKDFATFLENVITSGKDPS